jgi:hypothetical protein
MTNWAAPGLLAKQIMVEALVTRSDMKPGVHR